MSDTAIHVIVRGRVQGVCFRASTQDTAVDLGLVGWVRNCPDGSVEIHAEGIKLQLEKLIDWCRTGPPSAEVLGLEVDWVSPEGLRSFEVLRDKDRQSGKKI